MIIKLFLDMDGCLVDYDQGYIDIDGTPGEKGRMKAMRLKDHPHFYRDLKPMTDYLKLWHFVEPYHPTILSAKSNYVPFSKEDKIHWLSQYLHLTDPKRIIICNYPNDKTRHCTPDAILIDDSTKNCSEWINAGGTAIIHHSAEQTIQKLKPILHQLEVSNVTEAFEQLAVTNAMNELRRDTTCENVLEVFDELVDRT